MELTDKYQEAYGATEKEEIIEKKLAKILSDNTAHPSVEVLHKIFSFIDLTTLNTDDNDEVALKFCNKLNSFSDSFPGIPSVAAICVYPTLVETVRKNLKAKNINIAAVGAGFPSSQTFLSVKMAECELLVSKGADEIDIVISVGIFLAGQHQRISDEINLIKSTIGDVHLKVILETGLLKSAKNIRLASLMAMEAGADFIKTSTGKLNPAATPEAVYSMANAIKDYYQSTGRKVGLKPAGGIASVEDAMVYYSIISAILGKEWISSDLFRIGASRLANNTLSAITGKEISFF